MFDASSIVQRFALARLPLAVTDAPLVGGNREIFQLDIGRAQRAETFQLYRGAATNRVETEGVDRALRQLVLFVDEPRRRFLVELPRHATVGPGQRVVRREGQRRWIESSTDGAKRHFLCGMDEKHLFVAQLPRAVTTVRDAHRVLRAPGLDLDERRAPAKTIRQGEWFFVALDFAQQERVDALSRRFPLQHRMGIAAAARINRRGRQHVADEVLVARVPLAAERVRIEIYVRGAVRHPDHQTVHLLTWRRVRGNAEPAMAVAGMTWVD